MFPAEELQRYSRQIQLPEIGLEGQNRLQQAKVLVIGAGGLSCPALQYLVAAGVGTIILFDEDVVQLSNLQRQILYSVDDIGKSKVLAAKERLLAMNPNIQMESIAQRFTAAFAERVQGVDLVLDGSDNFATRYLVNDVCVAMHKPFIGGSILAFEGQTAVYNYQGSATYRCLYPDPPSPEAVPNCDTIGVLGVVTGVIGSLMATNALRLILGLDEELGNRLWTWNAATMQFHSFQFLAAEPIQGIDYRITDYAFACGETVLEISWEAYQASLASGEEWICIDVREPEEFAEKNKGGVNIPLALLEASIAQLDINNKKVLFCCRSGTRSKKAVEIFQLKGIKNPLYSLKNGLLG